MHLLSFLQTTMVGEPQPGTIEEQRHLPGQSSQPASLLSLVGLGAGVSIAFALLARIF
jgi:hypothetical protein